MKERGIKAHSTALTAELAKKNGYEEPLGDLQTVTNLKFGNMKVETFYPGKGIQKIILSYGYRNTIF